MVLAVVFVVVFGVVLTAVVDLVVDLVVVETAGAVPFQLPQGFWAMTAEAKTAVTATEYFILTTL